VIREEIGLTTPWIPRGRAESTRWRLIRPHVFVKEKCPLLRQEERVQTAHAADRNSWAEASDETREATR